MFYINTLLQSKYLYMHKNYMNALRKELIFILFIFAFSMLSTPYMIAQAQSISYSKYDKNGVQFDFPSNWVRSKDTDSQVVFKTTIPPDPRFTGDVGHYLSVSLTILPVSPNTKLSDVQSYLINKLIPETFKDNTFLSFNEGDSAISQGDRAHWIEYKIRANGGVGDEYSALNFFTIRGDKAYVFFYVVSQISDTVVVGLSPDNYSIYLKQVFQHMLDSFKISINNAPSENNPPPTSNPPQIPKSAEKTRILGTKDSNTPITELWVNPKYKPSSNSIYQVILGCSVSKYLCLKSPDNIRTVQVLIGSNCATSPTKCNIGYAKILREPNTLDWWQAEHNNWLVKVFYSKNKSSLIPVVFNQVNPDGTFSFGGRYDLVHDKTITCDEARDICQTIQPLKSSGNTGVPNQPTRLPPPPRSVPAECQTISQELVSDKNQKETLQGQLNGLGKGSADTKSELILQIKDLNKNIVQNEKKFIQCMEKNTTTNTRHTTP